MFIVLKNHIWTTEKGGVKMDKESFSEVILNATDELYRVSKAILKNDYDCEDAVQEAIAKAFQKLGTLRQEKYAKTWLIRILIHECYHILRYKSKNSSLEETNLERTKGQEDFSEVYQALYLLNDKQRLTIVLFYLEGYSIEEISRIMKTTQGTVKSRLNRGRNQLKKLLEEESNYEFNQRKVREKLS